MSFAAPRFIVLKSKEEYLGIVDGNGADDGYLKFSSATQAKSAYAKFEVEEAASGHGLVHIRSCRNNKYWERVQKNPTGGNSDCLYWIAATAKTREEDQSKGSCTLFKFIPVDTAVNTVRIMHVQSKCPLFLGTNRYVLASNHVSDGSSDDTFTIINRETLDLPRYVAFKGDNAQYLRLRHMNGHPYLQFSSSDISDPNVAMEFSVKNDGMLLIKPVSSDKYWRDSMGWIWVDSTNTSDRNTWFRHFKVNDNTIALSTLRNNDFCKRLTADGKDDCLDACIPTITQEARLLVEEPVMERHIQGIKYDLDNRRVLEETVMVMCANTHKNNTPHSQFYEVKFSLQNTATRIWKDNLSLKPGLKATFDVQLPLLVDGKTKLSTELHAGYEFGKTYTNTSKMEFTHKAEVSPMSKMTANLVSTLGKYDIPFTYMQKDTLYNGKTVKYDAQDGTYTGSNFYNTRLEIKEVPLNS
ncbi:hypothetical protein E1A91_A02G010800v1 [Gossypium mustelinum]|uniref:Agglutinin domain-containing protein n=1 Tax=Gossypium mustelinum TaxID=34275 RepID=A0A5D3A430_GOSMU|nr:hypothetical protein E1A91_A02G010800v1 [Gossypium mustelinum]